MSVVPFAPTPKPKPPSRVEVLAAKWPLLDKTDETAISDFAFEVARALRTPKERRDLYELLMHGRVLTFSERRALAEERQHGRVLTNAERRARREEGRRRTEAERG